MEYFGIHTQYDDETVYMCTCGYVGNDQNCPDCGNTHFKRIEPDRNNGEISSGYLLKIVQNGDWGFIVKKFRVFGRFNRNKKSLTYIKDESQTLHYDFRNNKFSIEDQKLNVDNMKSFFHLIDDNYFATVVCTTKFGELFRFATNNLSYKTHWRQYKTSKIQNISTGLLSLSQRPDYQIFASLGFNNSMLSSYHSLAMYSRTINRSATKPHEILKIPKYLLNYIIEFQVLDGSKIIDNLRTLDIKLGADNVKAIFEKLSDECDTYAIRSFFSSGIDLYLELIENYSYNPKQLINYVCREVKLQQGIVKPDDALTVLRDYMRMMTSMTLHPDKYSKSLKKDHDIALLNYKTNEDQFVKNAFKQVISKPGYKNLEMKLDKYVVVTPNEPSDLVKEGTSLSHCVASYVNDVNKCKCQIFFLRFKETPDASLLTIEVRNERIVQVKGFGNRSPCAEEKEIIKEWAEKKCLEYTIS